MLQLVVGMANQGYLSLQGSPVLVKYVAQQAAIPDALVDKFDAAAKYVMDIAIHTMCQ